MVVIVGEPAPPDPRDQFVAAVRALHDQGGHITRTKVRAALDTLDKETSP